MPLWTECKKCGWREDMFNPQVSVPECPKGISHEMIIPSLKEEEDK